LRVDNSALFFISIKREVLTMAKMTGMKVKLYIEDATSGKMLAGQRNATLSRSAETIDATSKDSAGDWKESVAGFKEFSIDCDGAFVTDDAAYGILETAFVNSENVNVYLELPSGTKYRGNCTITDFSLEFPYDDLTTYSISLQGSGALTTEGVAPF
jgi:TP901-1 family phage major tail protein